VKATPENLEDTEVEIPNFLDVDRLLTDSEEGEKYGAYNISLRNGATD
jgi:hypothetical protein